MLWPGCFTEIFEVKMFATFLVSHWNKKKLVKDNNALLVEFSKFVCLIIKFTKHVLYIYTLTKKAARFKQETKEADWNTVVKHRVTIPCKGLSISHEIERPLQGIVTLCFATLITLKF